MNPTDKDMTKLLITNMGNLQKRVASLETEIAKLTQMGTTQGKWYVRKDRSKKTGMVLETFYLLHPMRNGKRKKEYVGREAYQIRNGQDRMDRYKKRQDLIRTLGSLELKLSGVRSFLADACGCSSDGDLITGLMVSEYRGW